jgi:hypothetical protein
MVSPVYRSFFHIVRVQFKISMEEMRHICRHLGTGRPSLWRSPAWELLVVRRQLCASMVVSDARTASAFFNGHRPVPPPSSSAKKVVRHCEFSEKFGMLETHHVSIQNSEVNNV